MTFWKHGLICLGLVGLTLAGLGQVCSHDFIHFDDPNYVLINPMVKQGLGKESFGWAWSTFQVGLWQPLVWLSLQLDAHLFGPSNWQADTPIWSRAAWGFHLTNLLLHLANVLLLYYLLQRWTGSAGRSVLVAGLFAIHPLRVESVAWVTERKDVLSGFFFLLALLVYSRYARTRALKWYFPVLLFLFLGLASKAILVTSPFVLLLWDYWPLGRFSGNASQLQITAGDKILDPDLPSALAGEGKTEILSVGSPPPPPSPVKGEGFKGGSPPPVKGEGFKGGSPPPVKGEGSTAGKLVGEKIPLLILSLGFCFLTIQAQKTQGAIMPFPWEVRILGALGCFGWYLGKTFWPTSLAIIYPVKVWSLFPLSFMISLGLTLGITIVVLRQWKRRPYLLVGWFWYLGMLVPVSGIVQSGATNHADRFTYLPHIGLFIMLVWALADVLDWAQIQLRWRVGGAGLVLGILLILTWNQASLWKNSETVMLHTLKITGKNYLANLTLGIYYLETNQPERCLEQGLQCLETYETPFGHLLAANAHARLGHEKEAVQHARQAERMAASPIHLDLAEIYSQLGQHEEARRQSQLHLQKFPGDPQAFFLLGRSFYHLGQVEQARQSLQRCLAGNPGHNQAEELLAKLPPPKNVPGTEKP